MPAHEKLTDQRRDELVEMYINGNISDFFAEMSGLTQVEAMYVALWVESTLRESGQGVRAFVSQLEDRI